MPETLVHTAGMNEPKKHGIGQPRRSRISSRRSDIQFTTHNATMTAVALILLALVLLTALDSSESSPR